MPKLGAWTLSEVALIIIKGGPPIMTYIITIDSGGQSTRSVCTMVGVLQCG